MRSIKVSLLLGALFVIMMPAPAHAWFGWLDNLSGPGPFIGDEIEIRLVCFGGGKFTRAEGDNVRVIPATVESGCLLGTRKNHRFSIDLIAGAYWAIANNLQYADPKVNRRIGLIDYGALGSWSVFEQRVELKVGFEGNSFYGPAFDSFTRRSVVGFIDWKLFACEKPDEMRSWKDMVTLRVGALFFPGGFDSTDFGAAQGGFHTSQDLIKFLGVVYDFGARK